MTRPRVRRRDADGRDRETVLSPYAAAQDPAELRAHLLSALCAGVSGREQSFLHEANTPGVSKSEVSRLFAREGARILGQFRRDIPP